MSLTESEKRLKESALYPQAVLELLSTIENLRLKLEAFDELLSCLILHSELEERAPRWPELLERSRAAIVRARKAKGTP